VNLIAPRTKRRAVVLLAALLSVTALVAGCTSSSGNDDAEGTAAPSPAASGPTGLSGSWRSVGGDEFTGTKLNRKNWQPNRFGNDSADAPFNPDGEDAWFSPDNVAVDDGALQLTLQNGNKSINGVSYHYNSGTVQLAPGLLLKPGNYIEARIRIPRCTGCWPAFWAVPPSSWPPEIDIMEYFDTGSQPQPTWNYINPDEGKTGPTTYGDTAVDYRSGYHVYGLLWNGTTLTPYVDGTAYPSATAEELPASGLTVILNLSVTRGARPDAGARMDVDWVRTWTPAS
jgi:beta-glucanase (GH16 family)